MEQATYTVRLADGREFGPVTMDGLVGWAREGRVGRESVIVPGDGRAPFPALGAPALAAVLNAPPTVGGPVTAPADDDPVAVLIPYRNAPALIGYYLGIFGLLGTFVPVVGLAAPVVTIVLGVKGLKLAKAQPRARGRVHAWVAILAGSFGVLVALLFTTLFGSALLGR